MQRAASVVMLGLACASLVGGVVMLMLIALGNAHDARGNLLLVALGTLWPFWLSAAAFLASSFILARRRRKRGFPVERAEVRDQESEASRSAEAPKVRSNDAQGASPG